MSADAPGDYVELRAVIEGDGSVRAERARGHEATEPERSAGAAGFH